MRDYVSLALLSGALVGIAVASFQPVSWPALLFILILAVIFVGAYVSCRRAAYVLIACALVATTLGMGRVMLAPSTLAPSLVPLLNTHVSVEGKVVSPPDVRAATQRITVLVQHETGSSRVLAVVPSYPLVRYGEYVAVEGTLVRPEPFDTDTGRVFRYDRFLAKDGIFALIERGSLEVIEERQGIDRAHGLLTDLKPSFIDALAQALPEPESSLAAGLVAGGKQGLGKELLQAFTDTGLVHIVVLSGYNVMIIAEAVMRSLSFASRSVAAGGGAGIIALFILAAGAGAAGVRAGLMAGIALYARASGRTYDALRALCVAATLMLIWNPLLLIYDPGFQLSFIATIGLILGAPHVESRLAFITLRFLREIVSATIAAQIAVLPLLLFQTGLLSIVSLPANVLVLPVVPFAMALSGLAGVAGWIVPPLAPFFGLPAYVLLAYMIHMTEFLSSIPLSAVSLPPFSFVLVLAAYGGLVYLLIRMHGRGITRLDQ